MWKYCISIPTNGDEIVFPVYYDGTEASDYEQALDGVTLQELATMFPEWDDNIGDNIATLDMNTPNVLLSDHQDHIEDRNEECDNSCTGSIW